MAAKQKKDTELANSPLDTNQSSTITYANEVVAIIAGVAASEVEGIAGMCNIGGSGILNKNRNITRGVKVEIGTEEVSVDLYIIVEYGMPIQKAAHDAQENVRKAIESMTGLHVVRVDVHVQGVSFEKENSTGTLLTGTEPVALTGNRDEAEKAEPAETAEAPAQAEETAEVPEAVEEIAAETGATETSDGTEEAVVTETEITAEENAEACVGSVEETTEDEMSADAVETAEPEECTAEEGSEAEPADEAVPAETEEQLI